MDFLNKQIYTTNGIPKIKATIVFSNGQSVSEYINDNLNIYIDYHKPQFIQTATKVTRNWNVSGKAILNIQGKYFNGDVGTEPEGSQSGAYKPTIKYRYWKSNDTEPSTYTTISDTDITINDGYFYVTNYDIGAETGANRIDPSYSYKVRVYVEDKFVAVSSTISDTTICDLTKGDPVWTEYADRVEFDKIVAGNIDFGSTSITPTANTPTKKTINFNKTFSTTPIVIATAESAVIGDTVKGVSVANITETGCDIYIYRTNNTTTNVNWIAMC